MSRIEKIFYSIMALILIILVTGTSFALLTGAPAKKSARLAVPESVAARGVYDGIGRVRAASSDGAVVVAYIVFPFDAADRAFREELAGKRVRLREVATAFMASRTAEQLGRADEASVKASLRDLFNAELILGSVQELYFSEFQVIP